MDMQEEQQMTGSLTVEFILGFEESHPQVAACECGSREFHVANTLKLGAGKESVMIECSKCGAYRLEK